MTCKPCAERQAKLREAWVNRQIADAVKHGVLGVGEMVIGHERISRRFPKTLERLKDGDDE